MKYYLFAILDNITCATCIVIGISAFAGIIIFASISRCARHPEKTLYGCHWRFAEELTKQEIEELC